MRLTQPYTACSWIRGGSLCCGTGEWCSAATGHPGHGGRPEIRTLLGCIHGAAAPCPLSAVRPAHAVPACAAAYQRRGSPLLPVPIAVAPGAPRSPAASRCRDAAGAPGFPFPHSFHLPAFPILPAPAPPLSRSPGAPSPRFPLFLLRPPPGAPGFPFSHRPSLPVSRSPIAPGSRRPRFPGAPRFPVPRCSRYPLFPGSPAIPSSLRLRFRSAPTPPPLPPLSHCSQLPLPARFPVFRSSHPPAPRIPAAGTDGGDVRRVELAVGEAAQQARLAHARVAEQQQAEQHVVLLGHGGLAPPPGRGRGSCGMAPGRGAGMRRVPGGRGGRDGDGGGGGGGGGGEAMRDAPWGCEAEAHAVLERGV